MNTVPKYLKQFQLDKLSLILACVISLLFTKGVVEFLDNSSKKTDYLSTSTYSQQADSNKEKSSFQVVHHAQSPVENGNLLDGNSIVPPQQFRTLRYQDLVTVEIEKYIFKSTDWYLEQSSKNALPSRWSPTLFIAHRTLII
jgi:hypothetical protein